MARSRTLIVSTSKGLIVYKNGPNGWTFERETFLGLPVSLTHVDPHTSRWWAALAHKHWGQKLHYSTDQGGGWQEVRAPRYPAGAEVAPGLPATLRYIWAISHGGADRPGHLWIGTEPGGLFHSTDFGEHFELVQSLWDHPSRQEHWFGGGRDQAGIHSVVVDPRDSNHVYIAVSCAGVFETVDGGKSWLPRNKGLRADYLPDPYPEVGHDPHLLLACASQPEVMWQQNHCGVFRSVDGGKNWQDITDPSGLNYYGFSLGIDHANPEKAWVIPAQSDKIRVAVDTALCVCRTEDGGKSWQVCRQGLPQQHAYDIVLRHALAVDGENLAFGTNAGNLFVSEDGGDSWQSISHHLPKISAVCFG